MTPATTAAALSTPYSIGNALVTSYLWQAAKDPRDPRAAARISVSGVDTSAADLDRPRGSEWCECERVAHRVKTTLTQTTVAIAAMTAMRPHAQKTKLERHGSFHKPEQSSVIMERHP